MQKSAGLIGVGKMGYVILEKLLECGFSVDAFDPVPAIQRLVKEKGGRVHPNPASVTAANTITILCLPKPQHIRAAMLGEDGALESVTNDSIIIDTSTVDPQTSQLMAEEMQKKGAYYLDAPILGRPSTIGNWILPVGGDKVAYEKAAGLLDYFTKKIVHAGPSGAGNAFKLLNQLMFSTINGITAEVFAIAEKAGVDTKLFYTTVADSGAATVSGLFKECGRKIVSDDFEAVFPVDMLIKDAGLGIEMAKSLGTPPIIASAVQVLNETARGKGLGDLDTSALVKVYQDFYAQSEL